MNSSNSKSSSTGRERRRTLIACTNCRERKLKCRPLDSADGTACERCVKERVYCEYRPVEPSSAQASNYPNQDNPVNLYHVHTAPPPNQEFTLPVNQYVPTPGGYVPNQTFNPIVQAPFLANPSYPTPPYQQYPSPYHVPQYSNPNTSPSEYVAGQSNYQFSPQFSGHPSDQYTSYPPAHGHGTDAYGHSYPPFNGYENMDGRNSAKE